ncbi:helix-turn-helix transcriptional regulator [Streptomyces sp. CWNU-1]|uniref:Helix-turn-helix transcriptional regulator n=1 Tax=Streptomyces albipurpureus TaxID=2897419 RepID=A0ABT0US67_9ACTN|nr:helix-turn-helix transcriptional regulator [Streptomyces sp. CWNU-1]
MSSEEPSENLHPLQSFGLDIKQVRKAHKMTLRGLGHATGYSEGHVSKVEAGKVIPSERFAVGADRALGTGSLFVRRLRRILAGDHPNWFQPYVDLEQRATRIYDFSVAFTMGMLQTEAYARATFRAGVPREGCDVVESRVAARIRRHEVLEQASPPMLWVVLHEACLRTAVGGSGVMAEQLEHLVREAASPSVTLQVLPFTGGAPAHDLPFTLLEFDDAPTLVHAEGPQGGRLYDNAKTVASASDIYDRLRAEALAPADSLAHIERIAKEHLYEQRRGMGQIQLQRPERRPVRRVGPRVRVSTRRRPRT